MKYRILIFFAVLLVFCAVAWLSGYNFDERNLMVGYVSLVAIVAATATAHMVELDKRK